MRPSALAVFLIAILLCGARPAGAQSAHEQSEPVPERPAYVGAGGQFLISQSPGFARRGQRSTAMPRGRSRVVATASATEALLPLAAPHLRDPAREGARPSDS